MNSPSRQPRPARHPSPSPHAADSASPADEPRGDQRPLLFRRYRSAELGPLLFLGDEHGTLMACVFADAPASTDEGARVETEALHLGVPAPLARRLGPRTLREADAFSTPIEQLEQYLAGERREFTVPLSLALTTPFQQGVLRHVRAAVPFGTTTTYAKVAEALGRPTAARAVGTALGANPLCVFVGCHRVLGGDGRLTGYAGGLEAKERLLRLEGSFAQEGLLPPATW